MIFLCGQNVLCTTGNTGPQCNVSCGTSHYLDDTATLMRFRRVAQAIDRLHRCVDRCIESNRIFRTSNIKIDRSRNTDRVDALLRKSACTIKGTISTNNNYTFDSIFFKVLNTFKLTFKLGKLGIASRLKESTTTAEDVVYAFGIKLEDISFNHTSVSTVNAEYFNSFRNCFENNCASGSVHTRGISTTGQNSNTFHYSWYSFYIFNIFIITQRILNGFKFEKIYWFFLS